jgi:hypothetical protein
MNSVNRAMGRPDLYPFVLAPAVVEKLRFIHELVRGAGAASREGKDKTRHGLAPLASVPFARTTG